MLSISYFLSINKRKSTVESSAVRFTYSSVAKKITFLQLVVPLDPICPIIDNN